VGASAKQLEGSCLASLARRKLLILGGKGGVGRTTVAAQLGLALAERGKRVLVATTGHDDRLAWMLDRPALSAVATPIHPRLWIQRLVPADCLREYGSMALHSRRLSKLVFGNRVVRRLLDAVPGVDDFAVLGKVWHEAICGTQFDVVIFDGPATGHLRLALGVPSAIVDTVFEGPLATEAARIKAALEDPEVTAAVLVSVAERWPLTELAELATALERPLGVGVGALVINKLWPASLPALDLEEDGEMERTRLKDPALAEAARVVEGSCRRGRRQRAELDAWLEQHRGASWLAAGRLELPWVPGGLESREALLGSLRSLRWVPTITANRHAPQ